MPLEQLDPLCWEWSGVQLRMWPPEESPPLRFQGREWKFQCYEDLYGIRFCIYPTNSGLPGTTPFTIEIYSEGPMMTLSGTFHVSEWRDISPFLLQKAASMSPEFDLSCQLTFRVRIFELKKDSDENLSDSSQKDLHNDSSQRDKKNAFESVKKRGRKRKHLSNVGNRGHEKGQNTCDSPNEGIIYSPKRKGLKMKTCQTENFQESTSNANTEVKSSEVFGGEVGKRTNAPILDNDLNDEKGRGMNSKSLQSEIHDEVLPLAKPKSFEKVPRGIRKKIKEDFSLSDKKAQIIKFIATKKLIVKVTDYSRGSLGKSDASNCAEAEPPQETLANENNNDDVARSREANSSRESGVCLFDEVADDNNDKDNNCDLENNEEEDFLIDVCTVESEKSSVCDSENSNNGNNSEAILNEETKKDDRDKASSKSNNEQDDKMEEEENSDKEKSDTESETSSESPEIKYTYGGNGPRTPPYPYPFDGPRTPEGPPPSRDNDGDNEDDIQEEAPFAEHLPRSKANLKTFVEASTQTTLTANSILCTDALSEDFVNMLDKDSNHDVKLHCNGLTTGAHKDVLCSRSPVLAKMLRADLVEGRSGEVSIRDMELDTFRRFLQFLYTGKLDDGLTFDAVMSLYEASDMYEVKSLKTHCADFLVAKLTANNACDALAMADAHGDKKLVEVISVFIFEKKVHRSGDRWLAFCRSNALLATEVLNRYFDMFGDL